MNTLIPGAPLRSLSPTSNEYQRAEGVSRAAKPARVARFTLDAPEHSGTIPGARGDILTPGVALTSNLAVIFTLNQHSTSAENGAGDFFIVLLDVEGDEATRRRTAAVVSRAFKKSHACFNCRQNASIIEFEQTMSICASTRRRERESSRS